MGSRSLRHYSHLAPPSAESTLSVGSAAQLMRNKEAKYASHKTVYFWRNREQEVKSYQARRKSETILSLLSISLSLSLSFPRNTMATSKSDRRIKKRGREPDSALGHATNQKKNNRFCFDKKNTGISELEQIWGIRGISEEKNNRSVRYFKNFWRAKKIFVPKKNRKNLISFQANRRQPLRRQN